MKFWQKAFLCVLAVFIVGFDLMGWMLARESFSLNEKHAMNAALTERGVIMKSVNSAVSGADAAEIPSILAPYLGYYQDQGISFALYRDDELVFQNLVAAAVDKADLRADGQAAFREINGRLYIVTTESLDGHGEYALSFIKDEQSLADFKDSMAQAFMNLSIVSGLVLTGAIIALLLALTRPLRRLEKVAQDISGGEYSKRTGIRSSDEIGAFAGSFDAMAANVEEKVAELTDMAEARQRFVDGMAHELRTPVTSIAGYAEMLKVANCTEKERAVAVEHILASARRMQGLSEKLLDLSYVSGADIELRDVRLADVVCSAAAECGYLARERGVACVVDGPEGADGPDGADGMKVNGDHDLLVSLLANLIDNAIKASEAGQTVTVSYGTDPETAGAFVSVADYGHGMDPNEATRITEPFYRVDKARASRSGGVGIGLALADSICSLHNATLSFDTAPESGTTVTVRFYNSMTPP
jgi:signal transduction histidine kinase